MKKFWVLLKVSVTSMLLSSSGMGRKSRKKAATGAGAMVLIAGLGLYLSGLYSSMLMEVLAPINMEVLVFIFMGMGALIGGLLFTTFGVKGVVFGGRDNDLLLSMPVSSTMLMVSRVTAIYLENLLFSLFVLGPAGVVCAIFTQGGVGHTLLFWVRLVIVVLALPLLDTALSVLLGALVAFLSTRMSKGVLGQNIVMAIYMVAVFWVAANLNGMIEGLAANAAGVKDSLSWAAPLMWMGDGLMGDWGLLLAFAVCCIIPFVLVVFVLGKVYGRAVTAFAARAARSDYKLSAQSATGQKKALLVKEAKRFFGTPMYMWNSGIGLIMLLAGGVAALVMRDDLREIVALLEGEVPVLPLVALLMGVMLSMCAIAAPSISLEGKYLWILREAPLGESALLWIKVGFELLLTVPCTVVTGVCLAIALEMPVWQWAALLTSTILFAIGHGMFGMLMGLAFPKLDAVNETVVVKQSLAVFLAMFAPMVLMGLGGGLWLGLAESNQVLALTLPIVLFGLAAAVFALILVKRGPAMLRAL